MAAPMDYKQDEVGVTEPSYCKLKNCIDDAKIGRLKGCLEILYLCQNQHEKILSEFKLLQIMIFKRNGQLRKEKSIQLLKRVQACLKRFHIGTKLYKHVSDLRMDIKSALNDMKSNGEACFIPARQMWIYTLFILQRYVELLKATAMYCIAAFEHLSCQFSSGMLIPQMVLFMGTVSRIWILSKSISNKAIRVYGELFAHLENIPRAPSKWEDPPLPTFIEDEKDAVDLIHHSGLSDNVQMVSVCTTRNQNMILSATKDAFNQLSPCSNDEEDLGEPITLQDFKVDENSNLRKRMIDYEDSDSVTKKTKIDKPDELQKGRSKEISKKMKKLQKLKLLEEKTMQEGPALLDKRMKHKAMHDGAAGKKAKSKSKQRKVEGVVLSTNDLKKDHNAKLVLKGAKSEKKKKQLKLWKDDKVSCSTEQPFTEESNEISFSDNTDRQNIKRKRKKKLKEKEIFLKKDNGKQKKSKLKISKKSNELVGEKRKLKNKQLKIR